MGLTANELSPSKATGGSNPLASAVADSSAAQLNTAPVAQRIEHLTTDQKVGGSNPFGRARKHPFTCRDASGGMFCSCRKSLRDTKTTRIEGMFISEPEYRKL